MATQSNRSRLHPIRIVIAVIIGMVLLIIAYRMYRGSHSSYTPAGSSQQNNSPNGYNTPSSGAVNQGGNPNNATTPSPNGTNGNDMSSQ